LNKFGVQILKAATQVLDRIAFPGN
jgi:hypothetical protein